MGGVALPSTVPVNWFYYMYSYTSLRSVGLRHVIYNSLIVSFERLVKKFYLYYFEIIRGNNGYHKDYSRL